MLLVVRFWEEFDENRDLARRVVGVFFALVVFRVRQNRRHSFTTCLRVPLRDQTRARKKSAIRSTTRDAREKSDEYFLLFFLFFTFFGLSFSFCSFLASGKSFFLSFEDHQFGVFMQKLKRPVLFALSFFLCSHE
jgi:hypothetical protein